MSPSGDVAVVVVSLGVIIVSLGVIVVSLGVVVVSLGGHGMVIKLLGGSLSGGLVVVSSSRGGGEAVGGCRCRRTVDVPPSFQIIVIEALT